MDPPDRQGRPLLAFTKLNFDFSRLRRSTPLLLIVVSGLCTFFTCLALSTAEGFSPVSSAKLGKLLSILKYTLSTGPARTFPAVLTSKNACIVV